MVWHRRHPGSKAFPMVWRVSKAWPWAEAVLAALGIDAATKARRGAGIKAASAAGAMQVWRDLDEWRDQAPETPTGNQPVSDIETRARLAEQAFDYLDAPPRRVNPPHAPVPYSKPLEALWVPNKDMAVEAALGVLE